MISQALSNKLIEIIKKAQPITRFSGNTVFYDDQIFTLPTPSQQQINNNTLTFR